MVKVPPGVGVTVTIVSHFEGDKDPGVGDSNVSYGIDGEVTP